MRIVDLDGQPLEEWRPGVTTRMRMSALTGSVQLCIFEQWCEPGTGAPSHGHAVEEVLSALTGLAEVWIEGERATMVAGQSVVIPAGRIHGIETSWVAAG